jgi:hypothetical protein
MKCIKEKINLGTGNEEVVIFNTKILCKNKHPCRTHKNTEETTVVKCFPIEIINRISLNPSELAEIQSFQAEVKAVQFNAVNKVRKLALDYFNLLSKGIDQTVIVIQSTQQLIATYSELYYSLCESEEVTVKSRPKIITENFPQQPISVESLRKEARQMRKEARQTKYSLNNFITGKRSLLMVRVL